jgi:hypothetical protein
MSRKLLFLSLVCILAISAQAQKFTLKAWNWETYRVQFQAPDNMVISQNDAKEFSATNKLISLSVYPRKGENLNYAGMKSALMRWAVDTKVQYKTYNTANGEKQPFYMSDLYKFTGCAIDGTKDNFPVTILLISDPATPEISFYVWISYAAEYVDDAVAILRSFKPMSGAK